MVALAATALFWAVGAMVWPGCIPLPIPPQRTAIAGRTKGDFQTVQTMTRGQVAERMGRPDASFDDLRVVGYRVNTVTDRSVWLFLFVLPMGTEKSAGGEEVAFIQFDEMGHAQKWALRRTHGDLRKAAVEWVSH